MLTEAAKASSKPYYLMSSRSGLMNTQQAKALREAGLGADRRHPPGARRHRPRRPLHDGSRSRCARLRAPPAIAARATCSPPSRAAAPSTNTTPSGCWPAIGLTVTREQRVATLDAATQAARALGYPVVLKAVSDDIAHKTELGLVAVGIENDEALAYAFARLSERLDRLDPRPSDVAFLVQDFIARRRRGVRRHLARSRFRPVAGVRHGRHRDRGHARLRAAHAAAARGRRRGDDRRDARRRPARGDPRPAGGRRREPRRLSLRAGGFRVGRTPTCSRKWISIRSWRCRQGCVIVDALIVARAPARG